MAIAAMLHLQHQHDAPRSGGLKVHQQARSVTKLIFVSMPPGVEHVEENAGKLAVKI
ncbi:hypothetical protein BH11MYX2_BH11MYX2_38960 [soil metagenome]